MTDETKGGVLIVGLMFLLILCLSVLFTGIQRGVDDYARCKAGGGETEFCLIGDGSR